MFKLFRLGYYCNCCKMDPDFFIGLNWKIIPIQMNYIFSVSLSHNFLTKQNIFIHISLIEVSPYWVTIFLNQTDEIPQLHQRPQRPGRGVTKTHRLRRIDGAHPQSKGLDSDGWGLFVAVEGTKSQWEMRCTYYICIYVIICILYIIDMI